MKRTILSLMTAGALAPSSHACGDYRSLNLIEILKGEKVDIAEIADDYRSRGARGLADVLRASRWLRNDEKYATLVDHVAKQKDALKSRLYWHTDFEEALSDAAESNRPILSLRLLGKLDEEFSCANSRLFREVLYSDPAVSDYLRTNFVLHWKSVRPVPIMTIDYGDGRKLKRTITGNSAHYVLDSRGRVIDALPGLYTPGRFKANLESARQFYVANKNRCSRTRPPSLASYHSSALEALGADFAKRANRSLPGKMADLTPEEWAAVAATDPFEIKAPPAILADAVTITKSVMEEDLVEKVAEAERSEKKRANLEISTANDSVRNEFVLHRRVHERLASARNHSDVEALNRWVYAELFLMPDNDPWLGLHTPDVFTGLENNGIVGE